MTLELRSLSKNYLPPVQQTPDPYGDNHIVFLVQLSYRIPTVVGYEKRDHKVIFGVF